MTIAKSVVEEFYEAIREMHVVHPSTAVHAAPGSGVVAGAAITAHCAWQCNVLGAHTETRDRYARAERALREQLEL